MAVKGLAPVFENRYRYVRGLQGCCPDMSRARARISAEDESVLATQQMNVLLCICGVFFWGIKSGRSGSKHKARAEAAHAEVECFRGDHWDPRARVVPVGRGPGCASRTPPRRPILKSMR